MSLAAEGAEEAAEEAAVEAAEGVGQAVQAAAAGEAVAAAAQAAWLGVVRHALVQPGLWRRWVQARSHRCRKVRGRARQLKGCPLLK